MDRAAYQAAAGYVPITEEMLLAGRSAAGGWKAAQLRLIGVSWPPAQGWKKRAIGRQIAPALAERFIAFNALAQRTTEMQAG